MTPLERFEGFAAYLRRNSAGSHMHHISTETAQAVADELERLRREVLYLRTYGNKDCTAQAEAAMETGELD